MSSTGPARLSDLAALTRLATRSGRIDPTRDGSSPPDLAHHVSLETPDASHYVGLDMPSALHPQTLLSSQEMGGQPLLADSRASPLAARHPGQVRH